MKTNDQLSQPSQDEGLEFDHGSYDAAAFTATALASPASLAAVIDHTSLKADVTQAAVIQLCQEAMEFGFACAMVNPFWVPVAVAELAGTGVPVGAVVGFPLGANITATKREEAAIMVRLGVKEIDMVLNLGLLRSATVATSQSDITSFNAQLVRDIQSVAEVTHDRGAILKVILETCLLSVEEKLRASELAITAGADFIKTSTGFSSGGATAADVALLRGVAGGRSGVKASGGIRTLADARTMLEAGANRLGSSSSIAILQELRQAGC